MRKQAKSQRCKAKGCTNRFEADEKRPWIRWCGLECEKQIKGEAKKIKPMSEKRKVELPIYTELRRVFLLKNPKCEIQVEGCTGAATECHHAARRGKNYLNVETFVAGCHNCHAWVENFPKEAREAGWLL